MRNQPVALSFHFETLITTGTTMTFHLSIHRTGLRLVAWLVAALMLASVPILAGAIAPAQAQAGVKAEFRLALEPYGKWQTVSRWGDVWVPANRPRDWQPYTVGHWVYTDDWGWYWASDQPEDAWGWVTYHYGRWVLVADLGWAWVPAEEWGPGWVQWRRGAQHVGWAPLPPEEVVVEFREKPEVWVFVRIRDFTAPRITAVLVPARERETFIRETVVENRTIVIREQRIAVNPGIPPTFIAAAVGRPLRSYDVRPRILAGTVQLRGAVEVRPQDLQRRQVTVRETIRETQTVIRPAGQVPPPQPLAAGEQGRLGDNPPRAARRAGESQPTTGQAPSGQQGQQPSQQQGQQQGQQPGQPQGQQQGRQRGQQQGQQPAQQGQQPGTQGRGANEQRQQGGREGRGTQQPQQGQQGRDAEQQKQQKQPGTQGRGSDQQRQGGAAQQQRQQQQPQQGTQGRGGNEQRQGGAAEQQRQLQQPQATQGRGGNEQRQGGAAQQRQQQGPTPRTEGRGGGAERQRQQPEGR